MDIRQDNNILFRDKLYVSFNPNRWYLNLINIFKLYFDKLSFKRHTSEGLLIFNEFMKHYYGKQKKYIDNSTWSHYQPYHFKDKCLIYYWTKIKLKNAKLLKNVIVIIKILTNIITKYYYKKN